METAQIKQCTWHGEQPLDHFYKGAGCKVRVAERRKQNVANGMCPNHVKRPIDPRCASQCTECFESTISIDQREGLPEEIICRGADSEKHVMPLTMMNQIDRSLKGIYKGLCVWCKIMVRSREKAGGTGYNPILLPQGQVPWIFFPQLLAEQGATCFIPYCTVKQNGIRLALDHDHVTGYVRGFACGFHNANLMAGLDDLEANGEIFKLSFPFPATKYYVVSAPVAESQHSLIAYTKQSMSAHLQLQFRELLVEP